jgi:hypothetical protein
MYIYTCWNTLGSSLGTERILCLSHTDRKFSIARGSVTLLKEIENEYKQLENEVKKSYIILIKFS